MALRAPSENDRRKMARLVMGCVAIAQNAEKTPSSRRGQFEESSSSRCLAAAGLQKASNSASLSQFAAKRLKRKEARGSLRSSGRLSRKDRRHGSLTSTSRVGSSAVLSRVGANASPK